MYNGQNYQYLEVLPFEYEEEVDEGYFGNAFEAEWVGEVSRSSLEHVRWIQSSLNKILGLHLAEDGKIGPATRSAIRSFQQKQGLAIDGKVGKQTEAAIKAALTAEAAPAAPQPRPSVTTGAGQQTQTMTNAPAKATQAPFFPAKSADSVGTPSPLPVPLFPPKPADPLVTDPKMERALMNAIKQVERTRNFTPGTYPIRFTLVDVTDPSSSFPSAGYLETVTDYIASEAKVAIMYSAYALRDMVQRFAASIGANTANLFARLATIMNPSILKVSRNIAQSLLMDEHRVPSYRNVFTMKPAAWGLRATVSFSPAYNRALEGMIVPSNNIDASVCVHGIGYGYLNGALAAGGFFEPSTDQGLWVGGDFRQGGKWPYVRIPSRNDGLVAQAGTTRDMAKLVSLIMTDRLLDPESCKEMRGRLVRTVKVDKPWVARTGIFKPGTITHNKLGLGPLKSRKLVRSEVSVYQSPVANGRRYVVAWQNLAWVWPTGITDIAKIIKAAITEFER